MTNAHDILYPSKGRTSALVSQGTYFKVGSARVTKLTTVLRSFPQGLGDVCSGVDGEAVEESGVERARGVYLSLCAALRLEFRFSGARATRSAES